MGRHSLVDRVDSVTEGSLVRSSLPHSISDIELFLWACTSIDVSNWLLLAVQVSVALRVLLFLLKLKLFYWQSDAAACTSCGMQDKHWFVRVPQMHKSDTHLPGEGTIIKVSTVWPLTSAKTICDGKGFLTKLQNLPGLLSKLLGFRLQQKVRKSLLQSV